MYNEEDIRHLCTQDITYLRAQKVLAEGKVSRIRTEESEDGEEAFYIEANVEGSSGENAYGSGLIWKRMPLKITSASAKPTATMMGCASTVALWH